MLEWLKERLQPAPAPRASRTEAGARNRHAVTGPYALLHTYLDNRFADTVVLTFAQIEDVIGVALPTAARLHAEWWTDASSDAAVAPHHSDAWTLAQRTAVPNLQARLVSFAREL